jgi:hypothetical protein
MVFIGHFIGMGRPCACMGQSVFPQQPGGHVCDPAELPASITARFAETENPSTVINKYA